MEQQEGGTVEVGAEEQMCLSSLPCNNESISFDGRLGTAFRIPTCSLPRFQAQEGH